MVISGIWHGASLKYIIWGALHGLGMVAQNVIEKLLGRQTKGLLSGIITFHFVCFALDFLRADGWQEALNFIRGFGRLDAPMTMDVIGGAVLMLVFFWISVYAETLKERSLWLMERLPILIKPVVLTALALFVHLLGPSGVPSFCITRIGSWRIQDARRIRKIRNTRKSSAINRKRRARHNNMLSQSSRTRRRQKQRK